MGRRKSGDVRQNAQHPDVDERLVMPESGVELLDGKLLTVPGADPPHATQHAELAFVLRAHVAPGFVAVVELLTRTSPRSDFAPDASIYPEGPDARTGGRRLEVLAFEVVSKQRLAIPTKKARELVARGVPRVFAVHVGHARVLEWDRRLDRFRPTHLDETIDDAAFVRPLPVRALVDATLADEVALAAIEERRPELVARRDALAEARGEARGETRAARRALIDAARALGIEVPTDAESALAAASADELRARLAILVVERRWPTGSS